MGYLFSQTFIWLLLAFLLGIFLGWLLRGIMCRGESSASSDASHMAMANESGNATRDTATSAAAASIVATDIAVDDAPAAGSVGDAAADIQITDDMRPAALTAPNGTADDLKRIKGVGPVIEQTLNELGVFHFQQVADFSADNVAWVDNYISFPGRIAREGWVAQAGDLLKGVKTEFSERYDRGEVGEENPNRKS